MNTHFKALEFDKITDKLKEYAISQKAKDELCALAPYMNEGICRRKMAETTAARDILDACGTPPLASEDEVEVLLLSAETGAMLLPDQLCAFVRFAAACKRTASYLKRAENYDAGVAVYGRNICDLTDLKSEIESCVDEENIFDTASRELRDVRRKKEHTQTQIKEKLTHILQSRKQYLADSYISERNGHYVLPVQRRFQNQFGGKVIEMSGKGSTVFMEPTSVENLNSELEQLNSAEDNEVRRILYTLTASIIEYADSIRRNAEIMYILDLLFAKAKYSAALGARSVEIGSERKIKIIKGRHPLLKRDESVPLDFEMGENTTGVIITGPNTGGKTVCVKTVGLLTLMAQCGLHIPCDEGSYIAMQDNFLCDIGDSQNISQNLSTFSGHITNVISILKTASSDSLVLLDELGSGTDPDEGMGIAIAVLDELRKRKCMFLVTTHYSRVKDYAEKTDGICSARMAFDRQSLLPLYHLEMGKSGNSCALYIAKQLGLADHLISRAHDEVYGTTTCDASQTMSSPKSKLVRTVPEKICFNPSKKFSMGDSVEIISTGETGIVYRPADESGDIVVQIKGKKLKFKHNRIRLRVAASELYPPDYDFSIIFDTVENRKARHKMGKHNDPTLSIQYESEEYERGDK